MRPQWWLFGYQSVAWLGERGISSFEWRLGRQSDAEVKVACGLLLQRTLSLIKRREFPRGVLPMQRKKRREGSNGIGLQLDIE